MAQLPRGLPQARRSGGWIQTSNEGGHILEGGPRGFRPQAAGMETLCLAQQLGLENELVAADNKAKFRYLYTGGKLQRLPSSLREAYSNPLTKWLPGVLLQEMRTPRGGGEDESIDSFVTRRFGRRVMDELVDPLINGVFAGDPKQLSVRSCFYNLYKLEQEHGSVVRGLLPRVPPPLSLLLPGARPDDNWSAPPHVVLHRSRVLDPVVLDELHVGHHRGSHRKL